MTGLSWENKISGLQAIAQAWKKQLTLSGGARNLQKCEWYLMF
jgi:hypothetical protein